MLLAMYFGYKNSLESFVVFFGDILWIVVVYESDLSTKWYCFSNYTKMKHTSFIITCGFLVDFCFP